MSTKEKHWGDLDQNVSIDEEWGLSSSDMEDLLFQQAPRPSLPVLHQPSHEETSSFHILSPDLCKSDPSVLHTIRLLQHQRTVLQFIARAQSIGSEGGGLQPCPAAPQESHNEKKIIKTNYLNFLPPEITPFTCQRKESQKLMVEGTTARQILRKAVATVCAHAGFTDTTESVVKVLTDVTHEFLTKLTCVLRSNADRMLATGSLPFHDVVEQTFHDVGLGTMTDLHTMYRERVINYQNRARQKSLQLHQHYQMMLSHARENANININLGNRRESTSDWWNEDSNQPSVNGSNAVDDSMKSSSGVEGEVSLSSLPTINASAVSAVLNEDSTIQSSGTPQYQIYATIQR